MLAKLDLKGKVFNKFTVLEFAYSKDYATFWKVKCECGTIKILKGVVLKHGQTKSCGCGAKHNARTHGKRKSPEYKAWAHMKGRCLCKTNHKYPNYGGRGITMDDSWINDFRNFLNYILKSIGKHPGKRYSIDRIDNNGNYEPGNIRWATKKEQSSNTRRNIFLDTGYGKMIYAHALEKYKINRSSVSYLMKKYKISHQEAFNETILEKGCW